MRSEAQSSAARADDDWWSWNAWAWRNAAAAAAEAKADWWSWARGKLGLHACMCGLSWKTFSFGSLSREVVVQRLVNKCIYCTSSVITELGATWATVETSSEQYWGWLDIPVDVGQRVDVGPRQGTKGIGAV